MSGHTPEIAEVEINARTTGTREVQALQSELNKLNLSAVEMNRQQQRFTQSTLRQAEAFGKTKAEIAALRAEQLGLGQQLGPVITKWREAEIAGTRAFGHIGHAAKDAEKGIKGFFAQAGVMREMLILAHESLIMHRYGRFGGSLMVLAERANVAHFIFTGLAAGIAATAAAVATFGAAMVEGERQSLAFARALQMTGGYAGITEGQFNTMAETIGREIPGSISSAREAMVALMRTGAFSGQALLSVTRAAVLFGEVTGEKSAKVVADFAKMDLGVAKWAAHANESYHFLSLAQYDYIKQLEDEGQKEKAEQVAADALYHSLGNNAPRNLGYLIRAWYGVRDAISSAWDAAKGFGRTDTLSQRIAALQHAQQHHGLMYSTTPHLTQRIHMLEAIRLVREGESATKAHNDKIQAAGIAASQQLGSFRQSMLKGPDLAKQHITTLREQVKAALKADPTDPNALYVQAHWSQAVAAIDHRYIGAGAHHAAAAGHTAGTAAAAREQARFNTMLREEAANVRNAQAALQAEQSHLTASATAHKILAQQLQLEAWARKEIARYPDRAAAIHAFVEQQKGMLPSMPAAQATTPNTGRYGTQQAFSSFVASTQNVASQVKAIWQKMADGMTTALTDALTGQRFSLRNFAHGMFADMTSMVVKDGIMAPMASALGGALGLKTPGASAGGFLSSLFGGGAAANTAALATAVGGNVGNAMSASQAIASTASSGAGGWLSSIAGFLGSIKFANGGIMTPGGPLPLNRYANGGVANSPQVALFGEGRMPEAYVPLPDGRAIPVQMRGGGGGNVFHLNTTIHHSGAPGFDPQQAAKEMHRQFIHMMQREVIRQKRDGGLLATNGTAPA